MNSNKIIHEGEITLGETIIPCYVLEDGTRVLSGNAMQNALNLQEDTDNKSGTRLARYLSQKTLQPFIYKDKAHGHYEPIECFRGDQKINGYEATVLADICDAFLEARKEITLSSRQKIIADQCEILIRGFARVGIIALIDEATVYFFKWLFPKKKLPRLTSVLLNCAESSLWLGTTEAKHYTLPTML